MTYTQEIFRKKDITPIQGTNSLEAIKNDGLNEGGLASLSAPVSTEKKWQKLGEAAAKVAFRLVLPLSAGLTLPLFR